MKKLNAELALQALSDPDTEANLVKALRGTWATAQDETVLEVSEKQAEILASAALSILRRELRKQAKEKSND